MKEKTKSIILFIINTILIISATLLTLSTNDLYFEKAEMQHDVSELKTYITSECANINLANYDVEDNTIYLNQLEGEVKDFYNKYCYYMSYN